MNKIQQRKLVHSNHPYQIKQVGDMPFIYCSIFCDLVSVKDIHSYLYHQIYQSIFHNLVSVPIFANTELYTQKYASVNMANN